MEYTAAAAADPGTPVEVLADIARTRPDLHDALLANPSLYPELRQWLVQAARQREVLAAESSRQRHGDQPAEPSQPVAPRGRGRMVVTLGALALVVLVGGGVLAVLAPWKSDSQPPVAAAPASVVPSATPSPSASPHLTTHSPTPTPSPAVDLSRTHVTSDFDYSGGLIELRSLQDGTAQVYVPGVGAVPDDASYYYGDQVADEISDFRLFTSGVGKDVLLGAVATVRTPAEGSTPEIFTNHLRVYDPVTGEKLWETSGKSSELVPDYAVGLPNGDIAAGGSGEDDVAHVTFFRGRTGDTAATNDNWRCGGGLSSECNPLVVEGTSASNRSWDQWEMILLDESYQQHSIGVVSEFGKANWIASNLGNSDERITLYGSDAVNGCPTRSTCLVTADGKTIRPLDFGGNTDLADRDAMVDNTEHGLFYGTGDNWFDAGTGVLRTLDTSLGFYADMAYQGVVFGRTTDQYIAYDIATGKTAVMADADHPIAKVNGWILWESGLLQPPGEDVREVLPAFS